MLLGHDLWRDRYGGSPDIVGRTIRANGVQRTVIGVMPDEVRLSDPRSAVDAARVDPLREAARARAATTR